MFSVENRKGDVVAEFETFLECEEWIEKHNREDTFYVDTEHGFFEYSIKD